MQTFKLFLSPQVDVPDDVLQATGKRLKGYFDQICLQQRPRKFLNTTFKISPHSGEVSDSDLLAYITQGSSIINLMDKVFDPGVDHQSLLTGHAGGLTATLPDRGVLSEVFWTGGVTALKTSAEDRRAVCLANLIFHEWVHNKHSSDPLAVSKGEANGDYVHFFCGGGMLQRGVSLGAMSRIDNPNATNISAMARVLDAQNKQSIYGLYSDKYGF